MLIFSTILNINKTMTKEKFVKLVREWLEKSPHDNTRIAPIDWDGEYPVSIFAEKDNRWLKVQEYLNKQIIAARFEKNEDGIVWNTDFVMNFEEMRLAIQLEKSWTEDAEEISEKFYAPHFISLLIRGGFLEPDNGLAISEFPTMINDDNIDTLIDVINNSNPNFKLPVVYISKTSAGSYPFNIGVLSKRLKGVAHILVQESISTNEYLKQHCDGQNEYYGAVGIYYPNEILSHKKYLFRYADNNFLLSKIIKSIITFSNSQKVDNLYTWSGVENSLLSDRLQHQKREREREAQRADNEESQAYQLMDDYERKVESLQRENDRLKAENKGLKLKLAYSEREPILFSGNEDEFFSGEIREQVLRTLNDSLAYIEKDTRQSHIVLDILQQNPSEQILEIKRNQIKTILKGYRKLSSKLSNALRDHGFTFVEGNHYKLIYNDDKRYIITMGKTVSDNRAGDNIAGEIISKVF